MGDREREQGGMKDGMQRAKEVGFVKIRFEIEGFFAARMERNEKNSSGGKGENTRNEADQWGGQKEGRNTVIM